MTPDEKPEQDLAENQPSWERRPSENEAFAAPAHDPRDIITPHAFRVAPSLLGLPLATPNRRAIAIGADLLLVLMLTKTGGVMLAAVVAVFAYMWLKNRYRPSNRIARGLNIPARILIAVLVFAMAVSWLQPVWERYLGDDDDDDGATTSEGVTMTGATGFALGATALALKACNELECRVGAVKGLAAAMAESKGDRDTKVSNINEQIDETTADESERAKLKETAVTTLDRVIAKEKNKAKGAAAAEDSDLKAIDESTQKAVAAAAANKHDKSAKPEYSLLKQLYGMLDDLGLSIGWAAAYFTLFTTLWAGQTPGKRLMKIRVVHLGGKPMSYWMSFGRYGGYAAGLTTGLLGFLQIYWDPNRQAVQDQLSFTAVIRDVDLSRLKIEKKP
jgi:hypothetical protein